MKQGEVSVRSTVINIYFEVAAVSRTCVLQDLRHNQRHNNLIYKHIHEFQSRMV